jgi:hypothetical protein
MTTSSAEASADWDAAPDEAPPEIQPETLPAPPVPTRSGDWADAITLYVSNILLQVTESEVQKLFEPFGKVLKVYFKRDRTSLEFQGTAFVTMESHDAGQAAIFG